MTHIDVHEAASDNMASSCNMVLDCHTRTHANTLSRMHTRTHAQHMYVNVCICVYIHVYTLFVRRRCIWTQQQTHTHIFTCTNTHTYKHTHTFFINNIPIYTSLYVYTCIYHIDICIYSIRAWCVEAAYGKGGGGWCASTRMCVWERGGGWSEGSPQRTPTHCNTLQDTETHCNRVQESRHCKTLESARESRVQESRARTVCVD